MSRGAIQHEMSSRSSVSQTSRAREESALECEMKTLAPVTSAIGFPIEPVTVL
jgi:hypothetical protein